MINAMITVSKTMVAIQAGLFVLLIYAVIQGLKETWMPKATAISQEVGEE